MNISNHCGRILLGQSWHISKCLNTSRLLSFESPISLRNLYPSSSLTIKTPSPSDIPERKGQRFNGYIPIEQLKITSSRSSGPGGQHANKAGTKVDVRFCVEDAKWLDSELREKVKVMCRSRITSDGFLFVTSEKTRSQQLNVANCLEKLRELIWSAEGPEEKQVDPEEKVLQMKRLEAANRDRLMKKRRKSLIKEKRRDIDRYE